MTVVDPCTRCPRVDRHVHWQATTRRDLQYRALEAMGFCPDSGEPFEECIDGPCDCFLTRETVAAYMKSVQEDIQKIKEGL